MKYRTLLAILLSLACLLTATACASPLGSEPETTGDVPADGFKLDAGYSILIPTDAHETTRKAADLAVEIIREEVGLTLTVGEGDDQSHDRPAILLATVTDYAEKSYTVKRTGSALQILASDPTTLYFAVEAVLNKWLAPEAGMVKDGAAIMTDAFAATLNGLPLRSETTIKVLSQNLRYADDPNGNGVNHRAKRFKELLVEHTPDLIGTQEHTYNWDVWLKRIFRDGMAEGTLPEYAMVGCSREGRDTNAGEFNKILYRTDRFELLDSDTTWLSDTPDRPSAVEGSLCNRICTWALLKDKQTGETFLFANTHLDHGTDEVREAQMQILLDYLSQRIGEYPFYMTGDFNTVVGSAAYNAADAGLEDAHKTTLEDASTVTRTYHAYTEDYGNEIDFIFHNDRVTPLRYEIVSKSYGGFVSDHYGVLAEFVPNN
jgi:endonuclease/exonuclease/phosphatase family metal-dependent hydrolase